MYIYYNGNRLLTSTGGVEMDICLIRNVCLQNCTLEAKIAVHTFACMGSCYGFKFSVFTKLHPRSQNSCSHFCMGSCLLLSATALSLRS